MLLALWRAMPWGKEPLRVGGTPKDSFPQGNKAIARRAGGLFLPCQQLLSLAGDFSECNESGEGTEAAPAILLLSAGWSCLGSGITN